MAGLVTRIMQLRPIRGYMHYTSVKGPIFAQGMTLSAFYSLFAALFIAFAILMAVLGGNEELLTTVIQSIGSAVPGLIDTGDGGIIKPEDLVGSSIVGWGAVIASVGIVFTAINWIGVSREGFRAVFEVPNARSNLLVLKLTDLGVALGIGLLVLVSSSVLVVSTTLLESLGLGAGTFVLAIVVQIALDTTIVALLYRFGGQLRLPAKQLFGAALIAALGFFVLKQLASLLLNAPSNPLLAGIATIIIVLIWLGFTNQVLLIALAMVAVGTKGRAYTRVEEVEELSIEDREQERKHLARVAEERADRKRLDPKAATRLHKRLRRGR